MNIQRASLAGVPISELVERVLCENIQNGQLPDGLVLLEGPIAQQLNVSRAPVKTALKNLHTHQKITRFKGRGYLVGTDARRSPIRKRIDASMLQVSPQMADALSKQGTWEHFLDEVELEVVSCQVFGKFLVLEEQLSKTLSVSRTVAREILGRLQERGLVTKKRGSQWETGPLTAEMIRQIFELRILLEPSVILEAKAHWDLDALSKAGDRLAKREFENWDDLSTCLTDLVFSKLQNPILRMTVLKRRELLDRYQRGLSELGLPVFKLPTALYSKMLSGLSDENRKGASVIFREILKVEEEMYVARMKIVGVLQGELKCAPYVKPVGDTNTMLTG